jgi:hypothetical protein
MPVRTPYRGMGVTMLSQDRRYGVAFLDGRMPVYINMLSHNITNRRNCHALLRIWEHNCFMAHSTDASCRAVTIKSPQQTAKDYAHLLLAGIYCFYCSA